jgi:hypothetical protein
MSLTDALLAELRGEFPAFRIRPKRGSALSRCIDIALRVLTLGAQHSYLTEYHTVLGHTLYVPDTWESASDVDRAIVLRHERVHLRQLRRYGTALLAFLYLVPWFPVGLAWGRARLEWEAYSETLRATAQYRGVDALRNPELRARIVGRFVGGAYGFMWPFPRQVGRWFDEAVADLCRTPRNLETRAGMS